MTMDTRDAKVSVTQVPCTKSKVNATQTDIWRLGKIALRFLRGIVLRTIVSVNYEILVDTTERKYRQIYFIFEIFKIKKKKSISYVISYVNESLKRTIVQFFLSVFQMFYMKIVHLKRLRAAIFMLYLPYLLIYHIA